MSYISKQKLVDRDRPLVERHARFYVVSNRLGVCRPAGLAVLLTALTAGAAPAADAAPAVLVHPMIVERAMADLAAGRIKKGQLFVTIRTSKSVPDKAEGIDATAMIVGLGAMVRMAKADFSTDAGHCYETLPHRRVLKHWYPGRKVTIKLRITDRQGHDRRLTRRVIVKPLQAGNNQATKKLECYSPHL